MTKYEFNNFRYLRGPKKILSFGGWDFSTQPETYQILRQGTTPANRVKLATNIANFIKDNNLDGVDIDWEYPGVCYGISPLCLKRTLTLYYAGPRYSGCSSW